MTRDPREVLDRPAPPPDTTVPYGPLPEHVIDLRWPTARTDRTPTLVVVVHGGFWRAEYDRHHTGPQCAGLTDEGYAVAAIDYRGTRGDDGTAAGGGWPGTLEDVDAALDSVTRLAGEAAVAAGLTLDVGRTVLVGHSAGGHLVAWGLRRPRPGVVGAVSLAGVLDLAAAHDLQLDAGPGQAAATDALLGGGPDDVPDRYAAADPTRLGTAVPVHLLHGTADDVVPPSLSRTYAQVTGAPLEVLDGIGHFELIDPLSTAWSTVVDTVRRAGHDSGR